MYLIPNVNLIIDNLYIHTMKNKSCIDSISQKVNDICCVLMTDAKVLFFCQYLQNYGMKSFLIKHSYFYLLKSMTFFSGSVDFVQNYNHTKEHPFQTSTFLRRGRVWKLANPQKRLWISSLLKSVWTFWLEFVKLIIPA